MISFSSDVKSRMGVIIRPESEVYSTVQANIVEFEFPIGSVRGRGVRLNAGANQNRAAAVESRQRGGGCRPSLQAVPGGALSRAAATSSAGVHTEDHLEARSHFDVATGSASSMGESASTSATGASGGNFRVSSILPLIAAESTADRGSTPRASTTYGGVLVSTACDEAVGGNRQATTGVVRPNSANQKRQRIQRPSADGRLARPEAGFPGTWQQKPGQVSRSGEPARPSLCPSTVQAMTRSSISTSAAVTAGRDRHKFCQLLQRFRHAAEDRVMPRKLYKVLVNGRSCHGGSMEWSLPVRDPATGKYRPGSWHKVSGPLSMCESGIHLTTKPENWLTFGCQIFRAQPDSEPTQWYDDKCVVAGARLLYPVRKPAYWTQVEQFIGSIQSVPFFKPDGRPEPE